MNISGIWILEDLRKGEWSKLELQKPNYFSKNLLYPFSSADFFPKVHLKSVEGQAGKRESSQ